MLNKPQKRSIISAFSDMSQTCVRYTDLDFALYNGWLRDQLSNGFIPASVSYKLFTKAKDTPVNFSTSEKCLHRFENHTFIKACNEDPSVAYNVDMEWNQQHAKLIKCLRKHFLPEKNDAFLASNKSVTFYSKEALISIEAIRWRRPDVEAIFVKVYQAKTYEEALTFNPDLPKLPDGYSVKEEDIVEPLNDKEECKGIFPVSTVAVQMDGNLRTNRIMLATEKLEELLPTNYNERVVNEVQRLVKMLQNDVFLGKLVLVHGPVGTGKTFLVKSILRELRDRFDSYIILNPIAFFRNGGYYALVNNEDEENERRMLFIFEDCDKLFSSQVRDEHPDEFTALTNLTSGLVGSGRDDIFLFTFNREVDQIDPAYTRECRCLANLFVDHLDAPTLERFKKKYAMNRTMRLEAPCSLADVYAVLLESQCVGDGNKGSENELSRYIL